MKKLPIWILLTVFILSISPGVFAAIDDNVLTVPTNIKRTHQVTEIEFNSVVSILHRIYKPIIDEKSGLNFIMAADWQDETVNAYATREAETWTVHVAGGIARAPGMTKDSLALIVCHEIGHHLGGAPRTFLFDGWPAAEGQADYWAASKCLKNYYRELDSEEAIISSELPAKAIQDCNSVYKDYSQLKICIKTMKANLSFSNFLNALPDIKVLTSLESSDPREVKGTNTNHYPRAQCRVDTIYQGALCNIDANVATSESDAKIGHCNDTTKPGTRPRCWYRPQ